MTCSRQRHISRRLVVIPTVVLSLLTLASAAAAQDEPSGYDRAWQFADWYENEDNPVVQSKDRRDPLVVSLSSDGYVFNRSFVVASCASAEYRSPEQPDGCKPRNNIARWMPGPQYPQGVVDEGLGVLFVAFSVNKEDIWVKGVQLREM